MDTLDRYTIAYKDLSIGVHHISMPVDDAFFKVFDNSQITSGTGSVEIELTKSESMLHLSIEIDSQIGVECDRCLDEVIIPIEYESTLIIRFSDVSEDFDGDIMWLTPDDDELELAQYIYESIYLELPYQRVHAEDEDGNLSCNSEMLEHFKIVTEEEFESIATKGDTSSIDGGDWSKLQGLKEKMTQNK